MALRAASATLPYDIRAAGNWLNLSTPLGLLLAAAGRARLRRGQRRLILAEGYRFRFPVAGAFTVGNVIVTSGTFEELLTRHPRLLEHEEVHTWQYLYCLGLPYYLAYTTCLAWSMLRTGDRASANFFERRAGLSDGGYHERPVRPLLRRTKPLPGGEANGDFSCRRAGRSPGVWRNGCAASSSGADGAA